MEREVWEEVHQLFVAPCQVLAPVAQVIPQLDADRPAIALARAIDRPIVPAVDVLEVVLHVLVGVRNNTKAAARIDFVDKILRRERIIDHLVDIQRQEVIAIGRDFVVDDQQHAVVPAFIVFAAKCVVVGQNDPLQAGAARRAHQVFNRA